MLSEHLHPLTAHWFKEKVGEPTEPQRLGWPAIARGENTLIAAPTGSGKTLAAFLVCIDRLARTALQGDLTDGCKVLYISPLKALASDIRKNLEIPLAEIQEAFSKSGKRIPPLRAFVRTGDTPSHQRQAINKKPPHILVTTPESFYLMLTSQKGRAVLSTVETVIVDEIHALARDKRGSHLALSLERLKGLLSKPPTMIGLSATQKPIEDIAAFLVGVDPDSKQRRPCTIIDTGHSRKLDLEILVPPSPLSTVCTHEQWEEIYQKLAETIRQHRSTLLFVNTRRLAERVAFRLTNILGEGEVLSHHGSLSKTRRLTAENLLKEGKLKAIVATASLELGIDIGFIDLVCQIGVPFSIATFLQRIGRSGHAIQATPKGLLVPLSRDELVESFSLIRSVRKQELDRIEIPVAPIDVLCQQLIAEVAGKESTSVDEMYRMFTAAWPYHGLTRPAFLRAVEMAADGYAPGRRRFAYLIWDRFKDRLSVKSGARLAALTSGGAIPEMGDYRVVLAEDGSTVGSVNEDFAIESLAGDIFVLGTHSWRIRHVRGAEVAVDDAHGQPPTIPFWLGEAPGRTREFSTAVSNLREELANRFHPSSLQENDPLLALEAVEQLQHMPTTPLEEAQAWLEAETGIGDRWPRIQTAHYVAAQKASLGLVPTREKIVFERFFDDTGGMQLVIHSPYGARINRAWGLALRKRFCRAFDFELQASADDDGVVLSLGPQQSFPVEDLFKMLSADNVEHFLKQALLAAPMFGARWRWNATRALAVLRQARGKRVAPALQRFRAEDLLTAVFPAQTACQENAPGDIEIPDQPLVNQTVYDCLTEAMDIDGLRALFCDVENGRVQLIARDTREPSPFAYQLLNSYPYAFLDEAALEDRRTRSVPMRAAISIHDLQDLDRMDQSAIREVSTEAWPTPKTADEFYEVLVATPAFPCSRLSDFETFAKTLLEEGRAAVAEDGGREFLVAGEKVLWVEAAFKTLHWKQKLDLPVSLLSKASSRSEAQQAILKGWLEISGPVATEELQELFGFEGLETNLAAVEATGAILRCRLNRESKDYTHWCARGLLRRIHRLTVEGLREKIRPVQPEDYFEFILEEHGLNLAVPNEDRLEGAEGLSTVLAQLQGFEAPAGAWEKELLAGRMKGYDSDLLDQLTSNGVVAFGRLTSKKMRTEAARSQRLSSTVPLCFSFRRDWSWVAPPAALPEQDEERKGALSHVSSDARLVWEALQTGGALFLDEIEARTRLLESQVERALGELAGEGLVRCDHFRAFRGILLEKNREKTRPSLHRARRVSLKTAMGGRWSLLHKPIADPERREDRLESWAFQLLDRYGIVCRDIVERESIAPSWFEVVPVFRRLEARGEIRGGRFILGISGEQYGLSETHEKLLQIREERAAGKRKNSHAVISSADPLNLVGIITKEPRIAVSASTRILFEAGKVAAVYKGDEIQSHQPIDEKRLRSLRLVGTFRGRSAGKNDTKLGDTASFRA